VSSIDLRDVLRSLAVPHAADSVHDFGYCIRLCPWHRSSLLQKRLNHSDRQTPVEQTCVRPITVTMSSREPGHSSADETSVLLLPLSGTAFLIKHQSRTVHSWVENPSSTKLTPAWLRCFIHRLISPMHQTCITLMHV